MELEKEERYARLRVDFFSKKSENPEPEDIIFV